MHNRIYCICPRTFLFTLTNMLILSAHRIHVFWNHKFYDYNEDTFWKHLIQRYNRFFITKWLIKNYINILSRTLNFRSYFKWIYRNNKNNRKMKYFVIYYGFRIFIWLKFVDSLRIRNIYLVPRNVCRLIYMPLSNFFRKKHLICLKDNMPLLNSIKDAIEYDLARRSGQF